MKTRSIALSAALLCGGIIGSIVGRSTAPKGTLACGDDGCSLEYPPTLIQRVREFAQKRTPGLYNAVRNTTRHTVQAKTVSGPAIGRSSIVGPLRGTLTVYIHGHGAVKITDGATTTTCNRTCEVEAITGQAFRATPISKTFNRWEGCSTFPGDDCMVTELALGTPQSKSIEAIFE